MVVILTVFSNQIQEWNKAIKEYEENEANGDDIESEKVYFTIEKVIIR